MEIIQHLHIFDNSFCLFFNDPLQISRFFFRNGSDIYIGHVLYGRRDYLRAPPADEQANTASLKFPHTRRAIKPAGKAGGLFLPCKGLLLAGLKALEESANRKGSQAAA